MAEHTGNSRKNGNSRKKKKYVEPRCPLRPADKCSLCYPGATGPSDCGLVYLTMTDEELRELYDDQRARARDAGSTTHPATG